MTLAKTLRGGDGIFQYTNFQTPAKNYILTTNKLKLFPCFIFSFYLTFNCFLDDVDEEPVLRHKIRTTIPSEKPAGKF
jgi:hypothetical protein